LKVVFPKGKNGEESKYLTAIDALSKEKLELMARLLEVTFPLMKATKDTSKEHSVEIKKKINDTS
jgi:hypothetical protein